MSHVSGLFEMRVTRRVELRDRATREHEAFLGRTLPPSAVVRKGARVAVLDIFTTGAYVQLPDGQHAILAADCLSIPRERQPA